MLDKVSYEQKRITIWSDFIWLAYLQEEELLAAFQKILEGKTISYQSL